VGSSILMERYSIMTQQRRTPFGRGCMSTGWRPTTSTRLSQSVSRSKRGTTSRGRSERSASRSSGDVAQRRGDGAEHAAGQSSLVQRSPDAGVAVPDVEWHTSVKSTWHREFARLCGQDAEELDVAGKGVE
jgi:hypothetical protein